MHRKRVSASLRVAVQKSHKPEHEETDLTKKLYELLYIIIKNLVSSMKSVYSVKIFIFAFGRIKKGKGKPDGHETCPININKDSNQKQT